MLAEKVVTCDVSSDIKAGFPLGGLERADIVLSISIG